jgi:hypothetical protein
MLIEPPGQRRQPVGPDAVDSPAALGRRGDQPGRLQQLEMLHDGRARNRQTLRQIASGSGRARQALKDDHTHRMTEQGEQTQHLSQVRRFGVRLCHSRSVTPH